MKGFFIAGTDTGVGKTVVCGMLAGFLRARGIDAVTQKWVQTGTGGGLSDLAMHRRLMGLPEDVPGPLLEELCPYRFSFPASPRLASEREGRRIDPAVIESAYRRLALTHDVALVEGAGGFLVPLAEGTLMCDLVVRLELPVVLVVGNRLGCVNHALLTVEAIRRRGLALAGLIFNRSLERDAAVPEELLADNVRVVGEIAEAPVLGEVPCLSDPHAGAEAFAPVGRAFLDLLESAR